MDEETESKRVTVVFNLRDFSRIQAEVARRSRVSGYRVGVSDILRDLVRENWPVPAVSA